MATIWYFRSKTQIQYEIHLHFNAGFHKTGMLTIQNRNIKRQFLGKFSATLWCKSISYDAKKKVSLQEKQALECTR